MPGPAIRGASVSGVTTAMRRRRPARSGAPQRAEDLGDRRGVAGAWRSPSGARRRGRAGAARRRRAPVTAGSPSRRPAAARRAAVPVGDGPGIADEARVVEDAREHRAGGRLELVRRRRRGDDARRRRHRRCAPGSPRSHSRQPRSTSVSTAKAGSKPSTAWKALWRTTRPPNGTNSSRAPSGAPLAEPPAIPTRQVGAQVVRCSARGGPRASVTPAGTKAM